MKFLLIASYPQSIVKFRGRLLHALVVEGLEVHVAAPNLGSSQTVLGELSGLGVSAHSIRLSRTGTNPLADFLTMIDLWRLMRRIRPDYVLGYTVKPVIYGAITAWLARVPNRFALVTGLGFAFTGSPIAGRRLLRRLLERIYKFALSKTHKVIFQNPDDELLFRELNLMRAATPSCIVNGSGVDLREYAFTSLVSRPSFLLVARLLGDKGVREYAQAALILRSRIPSAIFRLAGWVDQSPNAICQSELDDWQRSGALEFLGLLSDVRPAIAECCVYVLPSYREGTPRTVLEAMAMGRPVITTDAPGCRETVIDGENGFLVPVKSVDALVDAMLKFIEDPTLAQRMGQRSRQIAEEKYDVHKVNQVMLQAMGMATIAESRPEAL